MKIDPTLIALICLTLTGVILGLFAGMELGRDQLIQHLISGKVRIQTNTTTQVTYSVVSNKP